MMTDVLNPAEAEEVVNAMINSRIDLLKLQNLRNQVRTSQPCHYSQGAIGQLEDLKTSLLLQIELAKNLGTRVRFTATFEIEQVFHAG